MAVSSRCQDPGLLSNRAWLNTDCFRLTSRPHRSLFETPVLVCSFPSTLHTVVLFEHKPHYEDTGEAASLWLRMVTIQAFRNSPSSPLAMLCQPKRTEYLCDIQEGGPFSGWKPKT